MTNRQRTDGATTASEPTSNRLITPKAILSYPHLFKAWAGKNSTNEPKFSAALVFTPEVQDEDGFKNMLIIAQSVGKEKWGEAYNTMRQNGEMRVPFKNNAVEKGYPEGSIFFNARSNTKPGLVMPFADQATGKAAVLEDESLIYAGAVVRASLTAFAYDHSGNKGVSFALNNIQWVDHGERLDSRVHAADEFDVVATTPVSIDDMIG